MFRVPHTITVHDDAKRSSIVVALTKDEADAFRFAGELLAAETGKQAITVEEQA
ncbi:hypothetical protein Acy02nite_68650 [Actinoplanes cyaneus]|uniref:Uncharacterized protein n=1 Tax=Actinoplanes cyaneus TaxID=52696 RepID=A0A919IN39_9ACTN|nr:hypothetical protein [Actinoplanes cyaneus]MCW2139086.1 hypothetical protein [Actinoplanes cyaneus]GID68984.1 hypothetical protein Acy02nite_68650 [Actinoplanes cyaneus]